jgi:hypothetical protein
MAHSDLHVNEEARGTQNFLAMAEEYTPGMEHRATSEKYIFSRLRKNSI